MPTTLAMLFCVGTIGACGDGSPSSPGGGIDGGTPGQMGAEAGSLDGGGDGAGRLDDSGGPEGDAALPSLMTVLDLGHAQNVSEVRLSGDRMLSQDVGGHWALWDVPSHRIVGTGQSAALPNAEAVYAPNLRGRTMAIVTADGVELRDVLDARVLTKVRAPAENLSPDGLYIWQQTADRLTVWARTGQVMLSDVRISDAVGVRVIAAPGELRIAHPTPAFQQPYIERLSLTNEPTATATITGDFAGWFADGNHFLVDGPALASNGQEFIGVCDLTGSIVRKIPRAPSLQSMGGYGRWVWTAVQTEMFHTDIMVFHNLDGTVDPAPDSAMRAGGTPTAVHEGLLVFADTGYFYDLRGPTIRGGGSETREPSSASGDLTSDRWVQVNLAQSFVVTPDDVASLYRPYGIGPVMCMAASPTGRVAVGTRDGQVRVYDLRADGPHLMVSIPFINPGPCALSADGVTLAISQGGGILRTHHLPDGALIKSWDTATDSPLSINLSRDGTRLLHAECVGNGKTTPRVCHWSLTSADGSLPFALPFPDGMTTYSPVLLSPNGERIATGSSGPIRLYEGGAVTAEFSPEPQNRSLTAVLGWLDDTHVLIQHQINNENGPPTYLDKVLDTTGAVVQASGPDRARGVYSSRITPIDDTLFFESSLPNPSSDDRLLSPTKLPYDASIWRRTDLSRAFQPSLPVTGVSAYAGAHVVYPNDHRVVAELWR